MIMDLDGIHPQIYLECWVYYHRHCTMASDLACCVAEGQYGSCAGVGRVLGSDGCVSVDTGEHGGELVYDVRGSVCYDNVS
jgi:hypothetical protein